MAYGSAEVRWISADYVRCILADNYATILPGEEIEHDMNGKL
jgi:hypothetical protein